MKFIDVKKKCRGYAPAVESVERRILCAAGDLDTSFNGSGTQQLQVGHDATAVGLQGTGKTILAGIGATGKSIVVTRLNDDGTLDTTFGSNGTVSFPADYLDLGTSSDTGPRLVVEANNEILVTDVLANDNFEVIKLTANGSLDTNFGQGGTATLNFGIDGSNVFTIATRQNGEMVVATGSHVAQLTANGALDTGFGQDGTVALPFGFQSNAIAIQSNGETDLAGADIFADQAALCRLTVDGVVETSLGTAGIVDTNVAGAAYSIALQGNGRIVLAGYDFLGPAFVARLSTDATPDRSFNLTGSLILPDQFATAYAVGIEWDGGILVSGSSSIFTDLSDFEVARLTVGGNLDANFAQQGVDTISFGDGASAYAEAFTSNHKLEVVGGTDSSYASALILLNNGGGGGSGGGGPVNIGAPGGGDGPVFVGVPLLPGPVPWGFHPLQYADPAPMIQPIPADTPPPAQPPLVTGHKPVRRIARRAPSHRAPVHRAPLHTAPAHRTPAQPVHRPLAARHRLGMA